MGWWRHKGHNDDQSANPRAAMVFRRCISDIVLAGPDKVFFSQEGLALPQSDTPQHSRASVTAANHRDLAWRTQ